MSTSVRTLLTVLTSIALSGCLSGKSETKTATGDGSTPTGDGGSSNVDEGPADMALPAVPTGPMGQTAAVRLLNQATYGASYEDIQTVSQMSYADWFAQQKSATVSLEQPFFTTADVEALWPPPGYGGITGAVRNEIWLKNALTNPDQLRQRMAFALSEIFVVSDKSILGGNSGNLALAGYYDLLANDAFGNFRDLLNDVTLNGEMGIWLSMMGNQGTNLPAGVHADENYAREVMQLFTVGLTMLNVDGTNQLDSKGNTIPSYTQANVEDLARVFTGWGSYGDNWAGTNYGAAQLLDSTDLKIPPMIAYPSQHDTTAKTIIGNVAVPAGQSAEADIKSALDTLFNHPNVGPFIGTQLIKRFVTSNPSPTYVSHVAATFNDDGTGTRGNLFAVLEAVLTDPEAINGVTANPQFGRLRESPLKMTHMYRAFHATTPILNPGDVARIFENQTFGYFPLDSQTVFNYFSPTYAPAGPITDAKEVAPEFQLITDNTIVDVSEAVDLYSGYYQGAGGMKQPFNTYDGVTPVLDMTSWETVGANATMLVAQMNLVLMSNTMPAAMQQTLVTYATSVTSVDQRIADLVDLIMNSPQYSIQR